MTMKPTIELITERAKLVKGERQNVDLLIRITPPELKPTSAKRPKLNIGIALDRSGSMGGPKMQHAREAAKYCVDQLLASDYFSAVIFDDQVDVLFTNQAVSDREILKRGLDRIQARNSTALHEGWVKAGLQVSEGFDPEAINRVLLITDGMANVGETNIDRIVSQAGELASKGITTTTIGIGSDFNEDLLMPMAEAGRGNAWHVSEPQDALAIFETELQGLIMQFGHGVCLNLQCADGVRIVDLLNDFEKDQNGGYVLPDLLSGSPLNIVVRLDVPGELSDSRLIDISLSYTNRESGAEESISLTFLPEFDTKEAVEALEADLEVQEAVVLLMNARARSEAMQDVDLGQAGLASYRLIASRVAAAELFSRTRTKALQDEIDDLDSVNHLLMSRGNNPMARKRLAYRRERTRKGKE
ncbi:MAG: von Willebrand factor A [Acidobacteria bacterium OLB17]|nr:MAG: von Willebrand factor A [Acidobacteria bacterium OLB17]MCZ2389499.1 VWA domain-containing protein [Acidobacteriota bacterium]